ncbi:MAG: DNA repair protein rad52 [Claussenomyces sp. TS43310]|nr:MAG: DNA repair protein rad52 [Claussenomyces sp. TS43310]
MPSPGEQHLNNGDPATNPFEEKKRLISEYTAQEIATLQSRLSKKLGPEYISSRAGPSGQKVHYVTAEKCIQLANEVFGFNGWSSSIIQLQVDFVDENPSTMKVSLGLSVIVRVTLRDGTFHEDIGYGHSENCKGKAAAFEKAKKEGTTDALKRALRNFGNVMGNCIYDKEYVAKVTKIKVAPMKWDVDDLHRHSDYLLVKKESEPQADVKQHVKQVGDSALINGSVLDSFDDDFGDFDEADFSGSHDPNARPDEVTLPAISSHSLGGEATRKNIPSAPNGKAMPATSGAQDTEHAGEARTLRPSGVPQQAQPLTPNTGFTRSTSGAGNGMQRRPQDANVSSRPQQAITSGLVRVLHQPSRTNGMTAPASPKQQPRLAAICDNSEPLAPPPGPAGMGFFSAKAAGMLSEGSEQNVAGPQPPVNELPAFNPHAESPSIRKTPGVDHGCSKPLTRDLKQVPGPSLYPPPVAAGQPRSNILNPQLETARRIGAPGNASPLANRGMYKPPTMKRPSDGGNGTTRAPLGDLSTNGSGPAIDGGDVKRQKLNGV